MVKSLILAFIAGLFLTSCGKNDSNGTTPSLTESYLNIKAGSKWNYELTNNSAPATTILYTLTSTARDSSILGNTYHVFVNSRTAASEYNRVSGSDYYSFQSLPAELGGAKVENLYLKAGAAVNTSWSQNYNITFNSIPLMVTVTNKIEAKSLSRTVNATTYNNVIHVSTAIAVAGIPPAGLVTDIDYYYAPNHGLIENTSKINLNYLTIVNSSDVATRLKTAVLL